MDNFYSDERISSYLDGELSADEQARFKERLVENTELRQLVEELRALRGSLDLLPRYQLEPNFAERVLRRAEQQMLVGGDVRSSGGALKAMPAANQACHRRPSAIDGAQVSHSVLDESRRWRRRIVRPLIYAGAAIAAAILFMVFTPPRVNEIAPNRPGEHPGEGEVASLSKSQQGRTGSSVESSTTPAQPLPAADRTDTLRRKLNDAEPNLIVADYVVSPDTANQAFRRLLVKHDIALHEPTDGAAPIYSQFMDRIAREAESRIGHWPGGKQRRLTIAPTDRAPTDRVPTDRVPAETAPSGQARSAKTARADRDETKSLQLGMARANRTPTDFEIVYVEGSSEQINGLVSDLNADTAVFHSVALRSAPATNLSVSPRSENVPPAVNALKDVQAHILAEDDKPVGQVIDGEHGKNQQRDSGRVAVGGGAAGTGAGGAATGGSLYGNGLPFQTNGREAPVPADRAGDAKTNGLPTVKSGGSKGFHDIETKPTELEGAASKDGNLARAGDKSAPADWNGTVAKGEAAQDGMPPAAAAYGGSKAGLEARKPSDQYYAQQKGKDAAGGYEENYSNDLTKEVAGTTPPAVELQTRIMSKPGGSEKKAARPQKPLSQGTPPTAAAPSAALSSSSLTANKNRPIDKSDSEEQRLKQIATDSLAKQADRGRGNQGQSFGYAFWFYRVPVDAKLDQRKEQLEGARFEEKKFENAATPSTATADLTARPRPAASAAATPPSGPQALPRPASR